MSWAAAKPREHIGKPVPVVAEYASVIHAEEGHLPVTSKKSTGRGGWFAEHKTLQCQLAVAAVQTSFVIGSVYLKSSFRLVQGLHFHPVIFAFAREAIAGPVLCIIAYVWTGDTPKRPDLLSIFGLGLCLFLNQLFYIMGIDMSGVLVATCMQPSIPVLTALLGVMLGVEVGSLQKFAGIICAVSGSICMVMGGVLKSGKGGSTGHNLMLGNLCLFLNTVSMALYYLLAKQLVTKYNPVNIAAWAYVVAASMMGATAFLTVQQSEWTVPTAMFGPLIYWILVASIAGATAAVSPRIRDFVLLFLTGVISSGYYLLTWACSRLPASQVASFQCLQPFFGTILSFLFLGERPSAWDLGGIGVLSGLFLVVSDSKDGKPRDPAVAAVALPKVS